MLHPYVRVTRQRTLKQSKQTYTNLDKAPMKVPAMVTPVAHLVWGESYFLKPHLILGSEVGFFQYVAMRLKSSQGTDLI